MADKNELTASGFALRALFALLLVFLTINPAGFSFYHWATTADTGPLALKLLAGVVLLIGWVIYLGATKNAPG